MRACTEFLKMLHRAKKDKRRDRAPPGSAAKASVIVGSLMSLPGQNGRDQLAKSANESVGALYLLPDLLIRHFACSASVRRLGAGRR